MTAALLALVLLPALVGCALALGGPVTDRAASRSLTPAAAAARVISAKHSASKTATISRPTFRNIAQIAACSASAPTRGAISCASMDAYSA